jgi:hypothetical protein
MLEGGHHTVARTPIGQFHWPSEATLSLIAIALMRRQARLTWLSVKPATLLAAKMPTVDRGPSANPTISATGPFFLSIHRLSRVCRPGRSPGLF